MRLRLTSASLPQTESSLPEALTTSEAQFCFSYWLLHASGRDFDHLNGFSNSLAVIPNAFASRRIVLISLDLGIGGSPSDKRRGRPACGSHRACRIRVAIASSRCRFNPLYSVNPRNTLVAPVVAPYN